MAPPGPARCLAMPAGRRYSVTLAAMMNVSRPTANCRREWLAMHAFCVAAAALGAGACKPKSTCQPDEYEIQVVLHPGKPLNPGDNQESLPTTAHLVQL